MIAQDRISVNSVVRRRANVRRESAQRQLRGLHASAHDRAAFQHHTAIARFRQIGRRNQTVVSGAPDNDIESFSHGSLPLRVRGTTRREKYSPLSKNSREHYCCRTFSGSRIASANSVKNSAARAPSTTR